MTTKPKFCSDKYSHLGRTLSGDRPLFWALTIVLRQFPKITSVCQLTVIWCIGNLLLHVELDWLQLPNQEQDPWKPIVAYTPVMHTYTHTCSDLPCFVLIRSLLDILGRLMRFLTPFHTAREHLSFECCMIMLAKRLEPNWLFPRLSDLTCCFWDTFALTLRFLFGCYCLFSSRLSKKDFVIIWINSSTAMPQLVNTICNTMQ